MREQTWKAALQDVMPDWLAHEIDIFEGQLELRRQGKIDEKVSAETRLRRGVYGQRYDNGQRYDGIQTRQIAYPRADLLKGPETVWDAPGMVRIKVPFGGLTPAQMEVLAELADEYSDGILHVTTRQDFQLHFVHIDDTPDLMRRLAAVNITTQEACGNVVRNITACPLAGVCHDETFDVTPYSHALAYFLLGHDDTQDFGRKFKIAFSGCEQHACGLVKMHDLGFLAQTQIVDGEIRRGFTVFVGGGLGAIPHQAKVLAEFVLEEDILRVAQAIARVFARHGEKKNRNRARIKFLVADLGIDQFRRLVFEELATLPPDERHRHYQSELSNHPLIQPPTSLNGASRPPGFDDWYRTNVYPQRQPGYSAITVNLPLGDITSTQMFRLADLARVYVGDNIRTTVEQNIVLRWVPDGDLPSLYHELSSIGLGDPGAGTIVDITACPGTDTCKLGIASSRGLAAELRTRLAARNTAVPDAVKNLRINISGCFNSCGQHHIADIGFFGNSRRSGNHKVPHFQVVLGGQRENNAGSFGMAVGAVPAKRVPDVVDAITERYLHSRELGESFQHWIARLDKKELKALLDPFVDVPAFEVDPGFYTDWGDARVYSILDIGTGECAGEIVSLFSMEISRADSEHLEALIALDSGNYAAADERAYQAMLLASRALVRVQTLDVRGDAEAIVNEFRTRFVDTNLFDDKVTGKFAHYLLRRHQGPPARLDYDIARQLVEEAQLFIEGVHACETKLTSLTSSA